MSADLEKSTAAKDQRQSWLATVSLQTWQEFLKAGGKVMGFRENKWSTLTQTKPGDRLYIYLIGGSRFIGIYEIRSPATTSDDRIWELALFPCRVKVRRLLKATPEEGALILELRAGLDLFENLIHEKYWSAAIRHSLRRISDHDATVIERALRRNIQEKRRVPLSDHRIKIQQMALRRMFHPEEDE